MRSTLAFGGSVLLLAAIPAYAAQRQEEKKSVIPDRAMQRAVQQMQLKPGIHMLSYDGTGRVVQTEDGIFFNPGKTPVGLIMGFRLDWNEHVMLFPVDGPRGRGNLPVEVTGWLNVTYDPERGMLEVSLTDDTGETFHEAYRHQGRVKVDPSEFAEFVDEFFQFMNTRIDAVTAAGTVLCKCTCTIHRGGCTSQLEVCAKICTSCSCTCTLPDSSCSCECTQGMYY